MRKSKRRFKERSIHGFKITQKPLLRKTFGALSIQTVLKNGQLHSKRLAIVDSEGNEIMQGTFDGNAWLKRFFKRLINVKPLKDGGHVAVSRISSKVCELVTIHFDEVTRKGVYRTHEAIQEWNKER